MKFSCEKATLLYAINTVSRAVSSKNPIPALEGLLIEADDGIHISGYDLKTGIKTDIGAEVPEKGSIILNARLFGEIIRKVADDVVTISTESDYKAVIKCGMSEFNIMGINASDFPDLPAVDYSASIHIQQKKLKSMISQTVFAVSDSESRPVHTGELFEVIDGILTIVAVDGYRLALRREKLEKAEKENISFVVPGSALSEVEKIASDSEEPVKITMGAKHIVFTFENTMLISRRLEGEFLNYGQAIPKNDKVIVIANKNDVIKSIERVSLLIDDRVKSPVRCFFEYDALKMSTVTPLGRASDECPIVNNTETLEIGFNNKYLLDAVKAAPSEKIRIKLNTGVSPCVITPAEEDDYSYLYMVLPVRLKANE